MIKIFITGPPGIGKTTCVLKLYETLSIYNYKIGGFISEEIRRNGMRIGFKVRNLDTGYETVLASIYSKTRHRIGKYYVNISSFDNFLNQLGDLTGYDLIIIDEIGPMEMISSKFKEIVKTALNTHKPAIFTVHINIASNIGKYFNTDKPNVLFKITKENRDAMPYILWREIQRYLKR